MRTRFNLVLCIAAGISVALCFCYYSSAPAYAQAQSVDKSDVNVPTIHITREGALYLNDKPVNLNSLANEIKRSSPKASEVRVKPDKDTTWDVVSQVFTTLNAAKISVKPVTLADLKNSK